MQHISTLFLILYLSIYLPTRSMGNPTSSEHSSVKIAEIKAALEASNPTGGQLRQIAEIAMHDSSDQGVKYFKKLMAHTTHPNSATAIEATKLVLYLNQYSSFAYIREDTWRRAAQRKDGDVLKDRYIKLIQEPSIVGESILKSLVAETGSFTVTHPAELALWNVFATNRKHYLYDARLPKISEIKFYEGEGTSKLAIETALEKYPELKKQLTNVPISPWNHSQINPRPINCKTPLSAISPRH